MNRNNSLILYLVLSLVCLRLVGVHVHLHNHVEPHASTESERPHLSTNAGHDDTHKQDIDSDVLNVSLVKNPGHNPGQDVWSFLVATFVLAIALARQSWQLAHDGSVFLPVPRYLRPPILAPPN